MPFFSIIIPTYNRASKLTNTLEQLKAQTYIDFEVLVVEDGYNNGSFYSSVFSNDKLIYEFLQSKKNVSAKRNIGASKAQGKYFIFLDDDDSVTNNWLSDFADALTKANAVVAFCAVEISSTNNKKKTIFPETAYQDERGWGIFLAGAFAIKKEVFKSIGGYDEMLRYGENTELGIRLKSKIDNKIFISNINLTYNSSATGGSKNIQNTFIANNHILAKHKEWFLQSPILHFNYLSVLGVVSYKLRKNKLARKYLYEALTIQYLNPKAWSRFMISLFPFVAKKVWSNK
jgi:glycosyltransferase involved in cell wall biosynthesis